MKAEDFTTSELVFLTNQGLGPEDVMDVRPYTQSYWFKEIERQDKTIALGSPCKKAGHRLRSRRAHCVQCDTSKLGYQRNYSEKKYLYIAGSLSTQLIKIGNCRNLLQRETQMRSERYGDTRDWEILFFLEVDRAGAIEDTARSRLQRYIVPRSYWKDGGEQIATELLRCSYSRAIQAVREALPEGVIEHGRTLRQTRRYEFEPE